MKYLWAMGIIVSMGSSLPVAGECAIGAKRRIQTMENQTLVEALEAANIKFDQEQEQPAPIFDVLAHLSEEQQVALERKFSALPKDSRRNAHNAFPLISNPLHLYIARQLAKEADAAIVSAKREGWISQILKHIPKLRLCEGENAQMKTLRSEAESELKNLSDEIGDSAVAASILTAVKKKYLEGVSSHRIGMLMGDVERACPYFGVSSSVI